MTLLRILTILALAWLAAIVSFVAAFSVVGLAVSMAAEGVPCHTLGPSRASITARTGLPFAA